MFFIFLLLIISNSIFGQTKNIYTPLQGWLPEMKYFDSILLEEDGRNIEKEISNERDPVILTRLAESWMENNEKRGRIKDSSLKVIFDNMTNCDLVYTIKGGGEKTIVIKIVANQRTVDYLLPGEYILEATNKETGTKKFEEFFILKNIFSKILPNSLCPEEELAYYYIGVKADRSNSLPYAALTIITK